MAGQVKRSKATDRSLRMAKYRTGSYAKKSTGKHRKTRPWMLVEARRRELDKQWGKPNYDLPIHLMPIRPKVWVPTGTVLSFMQSTGIKLVPVVAYNTVLISASAASPEVAAIIRRKVRPS